jgi:phosphoglycerate kinase
MIGMIHYLRAAKKEDLRGVALVRLDFNTRDDWRMEAVLPTVRLVARTARAVVVLSHRGRPKAVVDFSRRQNPLPTLPLKGEGKTLFSLKKDAVGLSRLLGRKVVFIPHFDWVKIKKEIAGSPRGSIFLLENLRFLKGEEGNDMHLAKQLAALGDYYVNDAFAVSHRANASVAAITEFLPSYAGLEMEEELEHLSRAMRKPARPLVLVLGGAKASDKLGALGYFRNKADSILLGGGSANTMLALRGMDVKKSLRDTDAKDLRALRPFAARHNILAPVDCVWQAGKILDLGSRSIRDFAVILRAARTIVWSGPLGMTDKKQYQKGTLAVAQAIAKNRAAFSVAGGGETVEFLKKHKLDKKFSFISTGGGAMLDFLAGNKLPGIEALKDSA